MKKFIEWLKRINDWFLKPSPLSLLISLIFPLLFGLFLWSLAHDFPDYFSQFLSMSSGSDSVSYESFIVGMIMGCLAFGWSFGHWFFDLMSYIVFLFRKSSAPADDK